MIALCKYILQGGNQCGQAALKDGHYCRHHQFVTKAIAEGTPQGNGSRTPLPFVFPEDRAAVQINYFLLLQAINDGRVDAKTAGLMLRVLKACDANLKKGPLNEDCASSDTRSAQEDDAVANESHAATSEVDESAESAITIQAMGAQPSRVKSDRSLNSFLQRTRRKKRSRR